MIASIKMSDKKIVPNKKVGILDNFNKNLQSGVDDQFWEQLETYRSEFNRIKPLADKKRKGALVWKRVHYVSGFLATLSSLISLVLTLSEHQGLIVASSLVSAVSAAIITFFNPSKRKAELEEVGKLCELIAQDFAFTKQNLKKTPDLYRQSILERLVSQIKHLTEKINS